MDFYFTQVQGSGFRFKESWISVLVLPFIDC